MYFVCIWCIWSFWINPEFMVKSKCMLKIQMYLFSTWWNTVRIMVKYYVSQRFWPHLKVWLLGSGADAHASKRKKKILPKLKKKPTFVNLSAKWAQFWKSKAHYNTIGNASEASLLRVSSNELKWKLMSKSFLK